jgi:CheY-like chemotaxis protein
MMVSTSTAERSPIVLVIEDDPQSLEARIGRFEDLGFAVIPAGSFQRALGELDTVPGIDLVVTDINLSREDPYDKSGVDIARHVRETRPGVPVAAYSGQLTEDALSTDEVELFDLRMIRGGYTKRAELSRMFDRCVQLASDGRRQRATAMEDRLEMLRRTYAQLHPEVEVILTLSPDTPSQTPSDAVLEREGFRLRAVGPDVSHGRRTFLIWSRPTAGETEIEVYGYPNLYAYGPTESVAVERLVELLGLLWQDLADAEHDVVADAARMREFLASLFGGHAEAD